MHNRWDDKFIPYIKPGAIYHQTYLLVHFAVKETFQILL